MINRTQVAAKLQEFLVAAGKQNLAGEERRIAMLLLTADLSGTTDVRQLARILQDDWHWIADLAPRLEAAGIWCDGRSQTANYWQPDGCMGLICDILVAQGRASRIVDEFGMVRYGAPRKEG